MEAGHHMHLFTIDMFDKLDNGIKVNNLILLNGHFLESLEGFCEKGIFGASNGIDPKRMQVVFKNEPSKYLIDSV